MYDARYFGKLFASVAKDAARLSRVSATSCTITIDRTNLRTSARQLAQKEYVDALKRKFGKVTIIR